MNPVSDTTPGVVSPPALSGRLLTLTFIHQISWVGLKFQWRRFEQNRKAKAPPPGDSCCTRCPPGRSGSALTCSFLSKKLSCRGLGRASAPGLGLGRRWCCPLAGGGHSASSMARPHVRWGLSSLSHTKSLAVYANTLPVSKPNPVAQCLVSVLTRWAVWMPRFPFSGL